MHKSTIPVVLVKLPVTYAVNVYKPAAVKKKTDGGSTILKLGSKGDKVRELQNSLKEFISNVKKFNFSSAFDRKGAKSFLKSKGKAIQEIDLNEYILDENERKVEVNKKDGETQKKNVSCKGFNKKIRKELKDNMISYKQKIKSMKTINKFKNKIFENKVKFKKSKSKHKKKKPRSSKDNHFYLSNYINKGNKDNKKAKKFRSEIELKMMSDKNLKKLKPIKKSCFSMNKNYNLNNNDNDICPFVRSDTSKTDSTLFHLVSEFTKV